MSYTLRNTSGTVISSVTLGSGASATVVVRMTASNGASRGDHQAWLEIGSGGSIAHAAVYTLVK